MSIIYLYVYIFYIHCRYIYMFIYVYIYTSYVYICLYMYIYMVCLYMFTTDILTDIFARTFTAVGATSHSKRAGLSLSLSPREQVRVYLCTRSLLLYNRSLFLYNRSLLLYNSSLLTLTHRRNAIGATRHPKGRSVSLCICSCVLACMGGG